MEPMQRWMLVGLVVFTGCVRRAATPSSTVEFDPMVITGDLELEKLNAEELFAAGTDAAGQRRHQKAPAESGRGGLGHRFGRTGTRNPG